MRRVLVDTNVIVSALIFPGSIPARALETVIEAEQLVLTRWASTNCTRSWRTSSRIASLRSRDFSTESTTSYFPR